LLAHPRGQRLGFECFHLFGTARPAEPEAERDAAVVALLADAVTPDQIAAAQRRLAINAQHRQPSTAAQQMLATTDAVRAKLANMTGLDWSAAITGYAKR
jgi:hypothetical protein